jgi:phosphoglycolate phosphatase-like HAD superfamily hydrolase
MWYIGDSLGDAVAAKGAGIPFMGIARDGKRQAAFHEQGFKHCSALVQIAGLLLGTMQR